jgi:hypothetical protein
MDVAALLDSELRFPVRLADIGHFVLRHDRRSMDCHRAALY